MSCGAFDLRDQDAGQRRRVEAGNRQPSVVAILGHGPPSSWWHAGALPYWVLLEQ